MICKLNQNQLLITTIDEMAKTLNDAEQPDIALLDFSEAFDKVNHHKL